MQYVRVRTCCYCHNEKKTTIYDLRWTQRSDVTLDGLVTSRCYWKLIYALFTYVILIDLELLRYVISVNFNVNPDKKPISFG